jgi:hypothetical protein
LDTRQVDFNAIFAKDLPDERVLEDYSCALQERILAHGRIYVTENFICFYSNLFGVTTVKPVLLRFTHILGNIALEEHYWNI